MIRQIADALVLSWRNFAESFALFVPKLVAALLIVTIGWLVAWLARNAVRRLLGWVRFETLSDRSGASEMLRLAELPRADALVAGIVFWTIWLGFILSGLDALHWQPLDGLVAGFVRFVPRFLLALVIVALGFLFGNFVWRGTLLAAFNAGLPSARLLAAGLRLLVIALSVAMALEQLRLATAVVLVAFSIAFGAVMLGLALAFGLGGRDLARHVMEQQLRSRDEREADPAPHL